MDNCRGVVKLLYPYLDGELAEDDRCRVRTHLLGCLKCQTLFEAERSFLHLLRVNTTPSAAPFPADQITEFVRRKSSEPDPPDGGSAPVLRH